MCSAECRAGSHKQFSATIPTSCMQFVPPPCAEPALASTALFCEYFFESFYVSVVQICCCVTPCRLVSDYRRDIYQSRRPRVLEHVIRQQQYCQRLEFAAFCALTTVLLVYTLVEVSKLCGVSQPTNQPMTGRFLSKQTLVKLRNVFCYRGC